MKKINGINNEPTINEVTVDEAGIQELAFSEIDAAKLLGISPHTLQQTYRQHGLISHIKLKRRVLYRMKDLVCFLERHAVSAKV
jgi:hypothetical protein